MFPANAQRIELTEQDEDVTDDLAEIITGLSLPQKSLSPKFFYDDRGSKLFDDICELDEYYVTRTESALMKERVGEIAAVVGPYACAESRGAGYTCRS